MANMPWLKLYTEIRNDPKMQALTDTEFRIWIHLLCLSAEAKVRGVICISDDIAYPIDALARALFVDAPTLEAALHKFCSLHMVALDDAGIIYVTHFDDRQYDKPSDKPESIRERVRKSRETAKTRMEQAKAMQEVAAGADTSLLSRSNADETRVKHTSNATDIDIDSETDKDEELHTCSPDGEPEPASSATPEIPRDEINQERKEKQFSPEAKALADELKDKLKARGVSHFERDWHVKNYAVAEHLLKTGVPPDDIRGCITWLMNDTYWYDKVTDLKVVDRQLKRYQAAKASRPPKHESKAEQPKGPRDEERKKRYEGVYE